MVSRDLSQAASGAVLAPTLRDRLIVAVGGEKRFEDTFNWRTHYPERVSRSALTDGASMWAEGLEAVAAAGGDAALCDIWGQRFLKKWLAYQHAGARTMNWMITGPARFPVERNNKRMETEMKRLDELLIHTKGAGEWARRQLGYAAKRALSEAAKAPGVEHREKVFPGGKIVLNKVIDRVQLVFESKPDAEVITQLKSRAFRWSPREGAWQRQLTQNGVWAAEAVAKSLGASVGYTTGPDASERQPQIPGSAQ